MGAGGAAEARYPRPLPAGITTGLLLLIAGFIIGIVLLTKDDKHGHLDHDRIDRRDDLWFNHSCSPTGHDDVQRLLSHTA